MYEFNIEKVEPYEFSINKENSYEFNIEKVEPYEFSVQKA